MALTFGTCQSSRNTLASRTVMGSTGNTPRKMGSMGYSSSATSRLDSMPSSKTTILNTRVPLGPIPRTQPSKYLQNVTSAETKTMGSPRYGGGKDSKRLIPAASVLLDRGINSPRLLSDSSNKLRTTQEGNSPNNGTPEPPDKRSGGSPLGNVIEKKQPPPALRLDFIKAALSNSKQVYSNSEIRLKAAAWTAEKASNSSSSSNVVKKPKPKAQSTTNVKSQSAEYLSTPKQFENLKNEGFAPRGKSNELNIQIKSLKKRLGAWSVMEAEEEEEMATAIGNKSNKSGSSFFSY